MNKKAIIRHHTIAIATITAREMNDYYYTVGDSELPSEMKKDIYRILDKALEIIEANSYDVMAVGSEIREIA